MAKNKKQKTKQMEEIVLIYLRCFLIIILYSYYSYSFDLLLLTQTSSQVFTYLLCFIFTIDQSPMMKTTAMPPTTAPPSGMTSQSPKIKAAITPIYYF